LDESWAYSGYISESEIMDIMSSELGIIIDLIDDKYVVTRNESSLMGNTVPTSVKQEIKELEDEWSRDGEIRMKDKMRIAMA
jgi:hypothetical protein